MNKNQMRANVRRTLWAKLAAGENKEYTGTLLEMVHSLKNTQFHTKLVWDLSSNFPVYTSK